MKTISTVIIFFLCICFCSANLMAKPEQTKHIKNTQNSPTQYFTDSIYSLLSNNKHDTAFMDALFVTITKNRRRLKKDYLPLLLQYAEKSEKADYPKGQMQAYDRVGLQYRFNAVFDTSIYYHKLSLKIALQLNDSNQLYYNYNNLGQAYRLQDFNVTAINYYHKALKITEALGRQKSSSHTMNSLGATYVVQKDFNQAMHYFKKSSAIAKKLSDKRTLAYNYGSMGEVFLLQNQNDSAMYYFVESKKLIVELGSKRGYAVSEHLIGQAHYALGNLDKAEKYFRKALKLHNKDKNSRYQTLCNAYLGKIKTDLNQPDSAEFYLIKAKDIAESIHSYENLIFAYNSLFTLYKKTGNWQKAVLSLQQSHSFQDSIINIANNRQLQSLEVEYETRKKEQQIKLLSAENRIKNQRIKLGFGLIIALIISIVLGIYMQYLRKRQSILQQDKLKQQLMLSQMNPHFIFNALASIQSFMYKNDAKKAAAYMGNFASLSRSILNNSDAESITLDEEVKSLTNYLELEKMRMNSAFDYKIDMPDEIDAEFIHIPPMMLQPFIENAIKHGLKNIKGNGLLTLSFSETETQIKAEITDNGIGVNNAIKNRDPNHKSKATDIFKQRMKILQKKYRDIPEPVIKDLSETGLNGTKVIICLPIILE